MTPDIQKLVDDLRTFEGSDALGDGDFTICDQAADLITRLAGALEESGAALSADQSLMMGQGRWTNDAGYMTDSALWITKADEAIRQALANQGDTQ